MCDNVAFCSATLVLAFSLSAAEGGTGNQEGVESDVKAVALYVEVGGLCVSSDGQKCGLFPM